MTAEAGSGSDSFQLLLLPLPPKTANVSASASTSVSTTLVISLQSCFLSKVNKMANSIFENKNDRIGSVLDPDLDPDPVKNGQIPRSRYSIFYLSKQTPTNSFTNTTGE